MLGWLDLQPLLIDGHIPMMSAHVEDSNHSPYESVNKNVAVKLNHDEPDCIVRPFSDILTNVKHQKPSLAVMWLKNLHASSRCSCGNHHVITGETPPGRGFRKNRVPTSSRPCYFRMLLYPSQGLGTPHILITINIINHH